MDEEIQPLPRVKPLQCPNENPIEPTDKVRGVEPADH
jgi:hypothetical protein